jgi:hypothetical protein
MFKRVCRWFIAWLAVLLAVAGCVGDSQTPGDTIGGNAFDFDGFPFSWELNFNPSVVDLVEGESTTVTLTVSCTAPTKIRVRFLEAVTTNGGVIHPLEGAPQPDPRTLDNTGLRTDCTPSASAVATMQVSAPADTEIKAAVLTFELSQGHDHIAYWGFLDVFRIAVRVTDAPPTAPPSPPADFRAVAGLNSVRLSWQAAPQAVSYALERTDPNGRVEVLRDTTGLEHLDSNVVPDAIYVYRLRAVNALGSSAAVQASARTLASSGWAQVGLDISSANAEHEPSLVLDRDGRPVVAYVEKLGGDVGRLFVKRYDGAHWQVVGGAALNAASLTGASDPVLALDENDQPVVAYSQGNGRQQNVFVARYANGAWANVQAPSRPFDPLNLRVGSRAVRPAMAYEPVAGIVVAWVEDGALVIRRFIPERSELGWFPVIEGATHPQSVSMPVVSVRLAPALRTGLSAVSVAWIESDGTNFALYAMSPDPGLGGRVWRVLDALRTPGPQRLQQFGMLRYTGFGVTAEGRSVLTPTVVWAEGSPSLRVYPRTWTASNAWVDDQGRTSIDYGGVTLGLMVTANVNRASSGVDGFAVGYETAGLSFIDLNRRTSVYEGGWVTAAPALSLVTQVVGLSLQFHRDEPVIAISERAFGDTAATLRVRRYVNL